jgi:hypothetical protein
MYGKLIGLGVVVAAFLGLSGALWVQTSRLEAAKTSLEGERLISAANATAAIQCSDGVNKLQIDAAAAAASAASAVRSAQSRARSLQDNAQRQLRTPASVPGDDCKSASQRFNNWLTERALP